MNKIKISAVEMKNALELAAKVSPAKNPYNVLYNVVVSIKDNSAILRVSDMETTLSVKVSCESNGDCEFGVDCKKLKDLFSGIKNIYETAEMQIDETSLILIADGANYSLPLADISDFPKIPEFTGEVKKGLMPAERLTDLSKELLPFVAKKENGRDRGAIEGVYYKQTSDIAVSVATDANKLIKTEFSDLTGGEEFEVILSSAFVSVGAMAVKMFGGDCGLSTNFEIIRLANKKFTVWGKAVEGIYPNYEKVIPQETKTSVEIDKDCLIAAVKKAVKQANDLSVVKLIFDNNTAIITSGAENTSCKIELSCKTENYRTVIGFNGKFLLDILGKTNGNVVKLNITNNTTGVIVSGQKSGVFKETLTLLMPVRINDGCVERKEPLQVENKEAIQIVNVVNFAKKQPVKARKAA